MDEKQWAGAAAARAVRGPRSEAERDATIVEIVFALVSAGLLAGAVFLLVASPALFGDAASTWIQGAQWTGFCVFVARVLWVLLRWRGRTAAGQPSQPGRTRPDS